MAGLRLSIVPVMLGLLAPVGGALYDRFGARATTASGMLICTAGLVLLYVFLDGTTANLPLVMLALALVGVGQGLFISPNSSAIMTSAPAELTGEAGSVLNLMRFLGISTFLIDKPRGELPKGVTGNPIPKIGYFGWKTWELAFDNCRLPGSALIGEEGRAFYYISAGLERARAHTAARSIGLARGALEDATAYAQERRQFGQAIGDFQNTRFRLARMATDIEAARQLMYFVCDEIDQKRRCDKEAAMVKLFASEMAERVTSEALQVFGGAGYTTLHAVERYWRDARLTKIFEGTSEIQQRIISDHLLGKPRERGNAA